MPSEISILGRILYNIDYKICYNIKKFTGRHEKTLEIIFLSLYVLLQIILGFIATNQAVTLIIILFLFFLGLERIFLHVRIDYEREKIEKLKEELKNEFENLKQAFYEKS